MEVSIPQSLIGANGDQLYFNDFKGQYDTSGGLLLIYDIQGLDGADVRVNTDNRPQQDGLIIHSSYLGGRIPIITGRIVAPTLAAAEVYQDRLRAICDSIKRSDGRYLFTPTGQNERFLTVRLDDLIEMAHDNAFKNMTVGTSIIKSFQLSLIAGDPTVYTYTQAISDPIGSGDVVTIYNNGNVNSYPVIELYGDYNGFIILNETTGLGLYGGTLATPEIFGLNIPGGDWIEFVMRDETMYMNGNEDDEFFSLSIAQSNFWWLQPGANNIFIGVSGSPGAGYAIIKSNDAWA